MATIEERISKDGVKSYKVVIRKKGIEIYKTFSQKEDAEIFVYYKEKLIENMSNFPKELLTRMNTEVPKIRPAVISNKSLLLLDKIRAFRHFIRHAYDCELDERELALIQKRLQEEYLLVESDLKKFRSFVLSLSRN